MSGPTGFTVLPRCGHRPRERRGLNGGVDPGSRQHAVRVVAVPVPALDREFGHRPARDHSAVYDSIDLSS